MLWFKNAFLFKEEPNQTFFYKILKNMEINLEISSIKLGKSLKILMLKQKEISRKIKENWEGNFWGRWIKALNFGKVL